jgi:hypothetical protein
MAILTRDAILGAQDLKRQTVTVKEWGGEVIVTEMTAARRLEFERQLPEEASDGQVWPLLVLFCAVDEAGEPLFTAEDMQALSKKNGKVVTRVGRVALKLNRMGAAQEQDLAENFTESQG